MVRQRVMCVGHTDLWIGPSAELPAKHESRHPREIRPQREQLQPEHHPRMFVIAVRNGDRLLLRRDLLPVVLGSLDAPLRVTHRLEVLIHPQAIRRAHSPAQVGRGRPHGVEHAPLLPPHHGPLAFVRCDLVAEHALEHRARVCLHRQRRRGRTPRDGIRQRAADLAIARSGRGAIQTQFQRAELIRRSQLARDDLIDGGGRQLCGRGALSADTGQEAGRRRGMVAAVRSLESGDHIQIVAVWLEGLEHRRELETGTFRRWCPVVHGHAVGRVHGAKPARRGGRRPGPGRDRRNHGVQQRQSERGARATQQRSPWQRPLEHDHGTEPH